MIIDKKSDTGLPLPVKIMSVIPVGIGVAITFIPFLIFKVTGVTIVLLSIGILTAQSRITVDFKNNQYRTYILLFGVKFGSWQKLFPFDRITLTRKSEIFREATWSLYPNSMLTKTAFNFSLQSVNLNIRSKRRRLTIAVGKYEALIDLGLNISHYTQKGLYDFTKGKKEIITRKAVSD